MSAIQPSYVIAIAFLAVCVVAFRWTDIGINWPGSKSTLRVAWLPALYILAFAVLGLSVGSLAPVTVAIIAANTFMVGLSEELACRGILYQGLRSTLRVWPAIFLSSLMFGAVHLSNAITTGDLLSAALQSVTAFMTGIAFLAIRIRTGSLLPSIVLHGLWDFALISAAAGGISGSSNSGPPDAITATASVIFILPNFLFGLYLLRRISNIPALSESKS